MSPEEREWAMEKLGLNEPISVQYVKWVKNAFHGEFGISFKYKQDVVEVIGGRIGNTLVLGGIGFIIMFAGALLLGILCAWYENRLADRILCKLGTISSCIPEFWMALVLILIFSMIWYGGRISILIATVLCLINIGNAFREQTNRKESNF